ncbi:MAG: PHP domain-containing protein [Oscillospiraceae bacterium]|nr:PHP domain-containing protein [Oscillospiraceae bacterium]
MEFIYETHMHTSEVSRCAISTAAQQVAAYKKRGYAGIIVTDHFINGYSTCPKNLPWEQKMRHIVSGYVNAKEAGDKYGLDVFLGWEFTIRGSDFLTYGLDLDFLLANPNIDRFGVEQYSALVRKCGGFLAQAHPYRDEYYIEHKYPVEADLIDAVEVYNSVDRTWASEKALAFARKHNLPEQAGSDSHNAANRNLAGIALQRKAGSIHDIIAAIVGKDVKLVHHV